MSFFRNDSSVFIIFFLLLCSSLVQANPVACFNTNMGNFCMELFERQTPKTVANFRDYVDSGAYVQNIFHRSVPGFVVQGGGFTVADSDTGAKVSAINTFDPVENEFGISNTRGTVAMAKLGNDPNSATSQWFVNLADNSANLDFQNEGFTVFAKVLYNGMTVFDAIAVLQRVNFGGALSSTPTIDFDVTQTPEVENFVVINSVDIHDVTGVFDDGAVSFAVEAGENRFFDVRLNLVPADNSTLFELDPASIESLSTAPANRAVLSAQEGLLTIPSVMINETKIVNNVVLSLTDPAVFQFTLVGFE